jgi:hypothetical protein
LRKKPAFIGEVAKALRPKSKKKRGKRRNPSPKPTGRPPHYQPTESDRAFVNSCRIMDAKPERIARMLGLSLDTLTQAYAREIEFASMRADAMVVANLFRQLTKDDMRAIPGALAWARMRLKWGADRNNVGQFGKPGVMRLMIVNDPEEGLEEYRDLASGDATIEVSGHEPTSRFVDPFEGKLDPGGKPEDEK